MTAPGDRSPARRAVDLGIGAATLAGAAFAWGALVERSLFTVRRVRVPVLASGAQPVRILHLSDVHMAPWQRHKQAWIRGLADLRPDLIIDTGDNIGHEQGLEGIERAFEPFRGVPGVYVHGSNDYFGPAFRNPLKYFTGPSRTVKPEPELDVARMDGYLDGLGWRSLDNAATSLQVRDTRFELFGVDDPHIRRDRLDALPGALEAERESHAFDDRDRGTRGAARAGAEPVISIGVAHAPYQRILSAFVALGADLILAGHTHGGQVCVPGFGAIVTNCDIPRAQVKGLSTWTTAGRRAYLNVSAGLGTSIYAPYRFACRPEVSLITLVPRR